MINIATSQPVHWPVSPSPAVAPVAAVGAVAPTQRSQRDGQPGLGSDRQGSTAHGAQQKKVPEQEKPPAASQAAPILPNAKPKGGQGADVQQSAVEAKQQALAAQTAEEKRSEQRIKLLDVLSNVWKASAAVVDNALGRGQAAAEAAAAAAEADPSLQPIAQPLLPASNSQDGSVPAAGTGQPLIDDVGGGQMGSEPPVAYTEQGISEWGALELGRLVSKKA